MSYLKKSFWGLSWTAALRGITRLAGIGRIAILARILTPEQFGAFGIAAMALGLLEIMTETGVNVVLLQEKGDYRAYLNSAWVVSIARGLLISILIAALAPTISQFFSSPDSLSLLYLVALVPTIRGFINPACIRFMKELKFDREFGYRSVILITEISVSVVAALFTRSAVSFVWAMLASAVVEVVISWLIFSPRPQFKVDWARVKHVLNLGKWVTGFGVFDYLYSQGDNITVGRILGEGSLGIYRTAYSFSTLPVTEISQIYYTVMFPVFSEMRSDLIRLRRAAIRSAAVVASCMVVVGLSVWLLADPIVRVLLGSQWLSAIAVIKVLALTGIVRGLSYVFNPLFVAMEKQKYVTLVIFLSMAGLLITVVPFVQRFGVIGAAYAAMVGSLVAILPSSYLAYRLLTTAYEK